VTDYYISLKRRLIWGFNWAARSIRPVGVRRYGAETTDALTAEARRGYESLIPQLPYIASDYFGWGLVRTTTLAEGGERCDFRFKRLYRGRR
jgi:hypothetical protein